MHLYSALSCIVVHTKHFTIMWRGGSLLNHSPHTSYRWRGERDIEPIKCMRSPHTSYRWRGERVIESIKCMRSPHTSYRWRGERVIRGSHTGCAAPRRVASRHVFQIRTHCFQCVYAHRRRHSASVRSA